MLFRRPKLPLFLAPKLLLPLLLLLCFSSRLLLARAVASSLPMLDLLPAFREGMASSAAPLLAWASSAAPVLALALLAPLPLAALVRPLRGQLLPPKPTSSCTTPKLGPLLPLRKVPPVGPAARLHLLKPPVPDGRGLARFERGFNKTPGRTCRRGGGATGVRKLGDSTEGGGEVVSAAAAVSRGAAPAAAAQTRAAEISLFWAGANLPGTTTGACSLCTLMGGTPSAGAALATTLPPSASDGLLVRAGCTERGEGRTVAIGGGTYEEPCDGERLGGGPVTPFAAMAASQLLIRHIPR
mmetsp:Transcript_17850/g.34776  ORF Transcript_17850/g.34776 Transcript_17850/m.34776 type:complete len:298 (-) Transcript_17850:567-1460(-)